jgi:hypothetical protein
MAGKQTLAAKGAPLPTSIEGLRPVRGHREGLDDARGLYNRRCIQSVIAAQQGATSAGRRVLTTMNSGRLVTKVKRM